MLEILSFNESNGNSMYNSFSIMIVDSNIGIGSQDPTSNIIEHPYGHLLSAHAAIIQPILSS